MGRGNFVVIKTIFFDYDGVIVDSFRDVHKSFISVCAQLGVVGCPKDFDAFTKMYGENSNEFYGRLGLSPE